MSFNVVVEERGSIRIQPGRRFDFSCHGKFREASAQVGPGSEVVIDLGETTYMDSAALGMLIVLGEKVGGTKRVRLANASGQPRDVLKLANFQNLFLID